MNNKRLNLVKITTKVFDYYRANIKGNENESLLTVRKKLTRNWLIAEKYNSNDNLEWRRYGNCFIAKEKRTDKIVNILNDRCCKLPFNVDLEEKARLDIMLGLIEEPEQNILDTKIDDTYKNRFSKFRNYLCAKYSQALQSIRG